MVKCAQPFHRVALNIECADGCGTSERSPKASLTRLAASHVLTAHERLRIGVLRERRNEWSSKLEVLRSEAENYSRST